jgi:pyruvate,water dikinase
VPVRLTTINGYAYYAIRMHASFLVRFVPMMARLLTWISRADRRWKEEARPAYRAVVARWDGIDVATSSRERLVAGADEIVMAAARHYLAIQSSVMPAAYMTEALFSATYERLIRRPGDPPAVTFLLGFQSAPIRAEESLWRLAEWVRDRPDLRTWLLGTDARHARARLEEAAAPPGIDPGAWRDFSAPLRDQLARFGHMVYDLDFAKPVPADDPAPIIDELRSFVAGEAANPIERRRAAVATRGAATARLLARLSNPRRALFRRLLALAQRFGPLREDALADVGLGWPVVRRILRELGGRLAAAGAIEERADVLSLTADELRSAAEPPGAGRPPDNRRTAIRERKATAAGQAAAAPPPFLPVRGGARFFGIDWSRWMPARMPEPDGQIRGIATSPGRVTAPARLVRGPEEFDQMKPGEVLVPRITTPAWTPLFALASGVVTDVGGPLSHGSIVAREYRIPAVLGTGDATARIRTGERLTVDGDAGLVLRSA